MGSWSEIVSDIFNGWKKVVQNMRGIVQNGTKERSVRLATQLKSACILHVTHDLGYVMHDLRDA